MGKVFANGREVSGKATSNKTIAAFPDVCLSPPAPPAGPVPIPYPITSMASKTQSGTGAVKIRKKEVGKKNASVYSKNNGNEPATRNFGAGLISHTITGKTKFAAYSFDVLFEKSGAERFLDLTTGNHMNATEGAPGPSGAEPAVPPPPEDADCEAMRQELKDDRDAAEKKLNEKKAETGAAYDDLTAQTQSATSVTAQTSAGGPAAYAASNQLYGQLLSEATGKPYDTSHNLKGKFHAYKKKQSQVNCEEAKRMFHNTGRDACHAEMKVLNNMDWNNPPASIVFAINYPNTSGQNEPDQPCPKCEKFMAKACKCIEIYVCNPDTNEPESKCPKS